MGKRAGGSKLTAIELNWFRVGAIGVMVFAILGALAVTDSALTFVAQPTNGGVSGYTPCKDGPNVNCPNGGSAGFILNTNSTLCNMGNANCPPSTVALGTWVNMPSAATELMGNTSYRKALAGNFAGLIANLGVGCITGSNTVGAKLTLQYAMYSTITGSNSTNFQNTNTVVNIDLTTNPTCLLSGSVSPQVSTTSTALNSTGTGYLFRIVGSGGGGTGDNPRFYTVYVQLTMTTTRATTIIVSVRSATAFTAFAYVSYPLGSTTTENFDWIATNSSNTVGCGFSTDPCVQHGASSCSITAGAASCSVATTFTTAFVGTPNVVCTSRNPAVTLSIPVAVLDILQAQTLTV